MEKRGNQDYRRLINRGLDIWGGVINVYKRTGVNRSGDVAAQARELAVAVLIGFYLANHCICCRSNHEEPHQNERSQPQITIFSPIG